MMNELLSKCIHTEYIHILILSYIYEQKGHSRNKKCDDEYNVIK